MMDSDSDDRLATQAFVVDEDEDDEFDLDIPPTTGNEYLRRVRQEAMQCAKVVVADIDTSRFKHRQTVKVEEPEGCLPAPKEVCLSPQSQQMLVADFAELRQKLSHYRALVLNKKIKSNIPKLPSANDGENWCRLCFGRLKLKMEGSPQAQEVPQVDPNAEGQTSDTEPAEPDSLTSNDSLGTPPLLSIISGMDQSTVVNVLDYQISWLEVTGFTSKQGRWFFALLARLEKPLPPEACALIRTLARLCSQFRASMMKDDPRVYELTLLICIVAQYFNQLDLISS